MGSQEFLQPGAFPMLSTLKVCIDQRVSELILNSHTNVPYHNVSFPLGSLAGFLMAKMHFIRFVAALQTSEVAT